MRQRAPIWLAALAALLTPAAAGIYPGAVGTATTDAVSANDPRIMAWASSVAELRRGPQAIFDNSYGFASFGQPGNALEKADVSIGTGEPQTFSIVSLGDGGSITLHFPVPIVNIPGPDLAVFENSFSDTFLELAFVEVSSDNVNFFRFPSISMTPTDGVQEDLDSDDFSALDPTNLYNLAGKYRGGYGTPFNLDDLQGSIGLDLGHVIAVRIVDVVGSVTDPWATYDSQGHKIKDPFPTVFPSGGFDLDAVAVLGVVPEPSVCLLFSMGLVLVRRRRR